MTNVADSCLEVRALISLGVVNVAAIQAAWTEDRKCMSILQDRIFIAKRLNEEKV